MAISCLLLFVPAGVLTVKSTAIRAKNERTVLSCMLSRARISMRNATTDQGREAFAAVQSGYLFVVNNCHRPIAAILGGNAR
jgi:hypothetical protein